MQALVKVEVKPERPAKGFLRSRYAMAANTDRILRILQSMQDWTEEEVIRIHSSKDYLIYMLGFLPGFTYLGGLDERIHTPDLPIPEYGSVQEVWESEVLRQVFIHWILREAGSYG